MRGFAIYQIGRADPPRFYAPIVPHNFDQDQFLGSESIYKTNGSRSVGVYEVVPVAGQAQRLLGRPRASCIMLN
jgi:hypothetical protein